MPFARPWLALLMIAASLAACADHASEDPRLRAPVGLVERAALDRVLERLVVLEGTPAARHARSLRLTLGDCGRVGIQRRAENPELVCADDAADDTTRDVFAFAESRRGEADGALLWPVGETGRLELKADVDAEGGLVLEGFLRPSEGGALELLVPAAVGPDAPVLRAADALVYSRLRPEGGLRLARLLPEGGQADRMFALKGRLLEGALLRGTVELAFLPPGPEDDLPPPIGALHHRGAAPLTAALEEALEQLEATWPIERTPRAFATADGTQHEGGCFDDLPLLPGLAPCWVVTDTALVVGWQAEALDRALGPATVATAPDAATSPAPALSVDLARIARDDRARGAVETDALHPGDLFSSLDVFLSPAEGGVRFVTRLEGGPR